MAFALVHFTIGFVIVLTVLSVVSITRYRLTGAYTGGVWALVPDLDNLIDGAFGEQIHTLHASPCANLFFFHGTLDTELFRAYNIELTFISLAVLGVAFVVYDWRFGVVHPATRTVDARDVSDEPP